MDYIHDVIFPSFSLLHFVFIYVGIAQDHSLLCSEEDSNWVEETFNYELREGKEDPTFDMEEKQGFRLLEQERDFCPGTNWMENLELGMEQSRRMIFILSVYVLKNKILLVNVHILSLI